MTARQQTVIDDLKYPLLAGIRQEERAPCRYRALRGDDCHLRPDRIGGIGLKIATGKEQPQIVYQAEPSVEIGMIEIEIVIANPPHAADALRPERAERFQQAIIYSGIAIA